MMARLLVDIPEVMLPSGGRWQGGKKGDVLNVPKELINVLLFRGAIKPVTFGEVALMLPVAKHFQRKGYEVKAQGEDLIIKEYRGRDYKLILSEDVRNLIKQYLRGDKRALGKAKILNHREVKRGRFTMIPL